MVDLEQAAGDRRPGRARRGPAPSWAGTRRSRRLARRGPPRTWPASHTAARRSASVPAPRRSKPVSCVAVSRAVHPGRMISGARRRGAGRASRDPVQRVLEMSATRGRTAGRGARGGARGGARADVRGSAATSAAYATKSTATDPVSEADLAAEAAIRRVLGERRPGGRDPRRGGGPDRRRGAALDHRPAGRHDQLPVRDAPVLRSASPARTATGMVVGVVLDPVREETLRRHPVGTADAQRSTRSPAPRARTWPRRWWPRLRLRRRRAGPAGGGDGPGAAPRARHPARRLGGA